MKLLAKWCYFATKKKKKILRIGNLIAELSLKEAENKKTIGHTNSAKWVLKIELCSFFGTLWCAIVHPYHLLLLLQNVSTDSKRKDLK